jgi:hypothetical protein
MTTELEGLVCERSEARITFIKSRLHRDAAARYYDSVATEAAVVTQPAWDAFGATQEAMDLAGDHLNVACGAVIDHMMLGV